ncbi:MAG TPA: ATP-binding cassette domain-containing protein [Candidatus Lustribacter sp.]|nr:ATP-binding cassette domain-containing protein [Candidatus Lustribacter sp.]
MTKAHDRRPPDSGAQIEVHDLTKKFGTLTAVDTLSFAVEPGRITGFLGPNGAGKTTTLRMILGLVRPTRGTATIGGHKYGELAAPSAMVGSALEATSFHPGRSGRNHLRVLADAGGIPLERVDEMLDLVGIPAAANRRAGGYSMGMRQRLGLAAAMLGNPRVLILDEPANGLDPEGIRWLREFLRYLAREGRTILISSHLLTEVDQTVDDVVIIANGELVTAGPIESLRGAPTLAVRTSKPAELAAALATQGVGSSPDPEGTLVVHSDDTHLVGDTALSIGAAVYELTRHRADLEDLYFRLTETPETRNRNLSSQAPALSEGAQQ